MIKANPWTTKSVSVALENNIQTGLLSSKVSMSHKTIFKMKLFPISMSRLVFVQRANSMRAWKYHKSKWQFVIRKDCSHHWNKDLRPLLKQTTFKNNCDIAHLKNVHEPDHDTSFLKKVEIRICSLNFRAVFNFA